MQLFVAAPILSDHLGFRTHRLALPAVRAEGALRDVPLAVVGRVLQVDEVGVRVRLEPLKGRGRMN